MPTLSLLDNVMLPMDLCGLYQRFDSRQRALDLLRQVELADHAYKLPSDISGGQQQRVAIAARAGQRSAIIVADEPTGRLDSAHRRDDLPDFSEAERAQGKTIVMVTHDHSLAQRVGGR